MATITPIAYNNSGTPIPGTIQIGDLSIESSAQDYGSTPFPGNKRFWATPDEDLHYVIAYPVPAGNHPNPLSVQCFVGFFKSVVKTEESFINLANYFANSLNTPQNFTGGTDAKVWLNDNGYWTSYTPSTPFNDLETIVDIIDNFKYKSNIAELIISKFKIVPAYIYIKTSDYIPVLNWILERYVYVEMYEKCDRVKELIYLIEVTNITNEIKNK